MHISMDTDTNVQCEYISVRSEQMVTILGINIVKILKVKFTYHIVAVMNVFKIQNIEY